MFTKQSLLVQQLREHLPEQAVNILEQMLTNCHQPLEHRAPIGIESYPDQGTGLGPDALHGDAIDDIFGTLKVQNPVSYYDPDDGGIKRGAAAIFKGVVLMQPGGKDVNMAPVNRAVLLLLPDNDVMANAVWMNEAYKQDGTAWLPDVSFSACENAGSFSAQTFDAEITLDFEEGGNTGGMFYWNATSNTLEMQADGCFIFTAQATFKLTTYGSGNTPESVLVLQRSTDAGSSWGDIDCTKSIQSHLAVVDNHQTHFISRMITVTAGDMYRWRARESGGATVEFSTIENGHNFWVAPCNAGSLVGSGSATTLYLPENYLVTILTPSGTPGDDDTDTGSCGVTFVDTGTVGRGTGKVGAYSYVFTGANYLTADPYNCIVMDEEWTFEAWVKADGFVGEGILGITNDTLSFGTVLTLSTSSSPAGSFLYTLDNDFGDFVTVTDSGNSTGTWYHIMATYNSARLFSVYKDGALSGSGTLTGEANIEDGTEVLTLGDDGSLAAPFSGQLDGFRTYNRCLSAGEVKARYDATA